MRLDIRDYAEFGDILIELGRLGRKVCDLQGEVDGIASHVEFLMRRLDGEDEEDKTVQNRSYPPGSLPLVRQDSRQNRSSDYLSTGKVPDRGEGKTNGGDRKSNGEIQ